MAAVAEQAGVSEPNPLSLLPPKRNLFAALGSDLYKKTTAGVALSNLDELIHYLDLTVSEAAETAAG